MTSFRVMSTVRIAPSLIFIFIVSFSRAARIPCIDALPSALLLCLLNPTEPDARCQHSAEFARRSMEIPMAVQPSSATARERHQGIHTVAVVMATTHSVANNDVRQTFGRRVLL